MSQDPFFVHETAVVDPGAHIGAGAKVWHFCHVSSGAVLGERVSLGQNCYVAPTVTVGDGSKIQNNVSLYDGVTLERDVFVGPSAVFTNVRTPRAHVSRKDEYEETHVGRGASIGANATVVSGVHIGAYAMIGAGAVVTRDVGSFELVTGAPSRHVGWVCQCGHRLRDVARHAECERCGATYMMIEDELYWLNEDE